MTNRERVLTALDHQQPDRTPYRIGLTERMMESMVAYCGGNDFLGHIDNCLHFVRPAPGPKERWLNDNLWQDEFGVQWDRSIDRDIGNVCNVVLPERDLRRLELPDPRPRFEGFARRCAEAGERFVVLAVDFSLFERAWTLRGGMAEFLTDMMEAPAFAGELLVAICDHNVTLIRQAAKYDIDAVYFGDDWGSQKSLLLSPRLWENLLAPRLVREYAAAKEAGKFVTIHSCGKVQELFPRLIEIGVDCFNPFQPEVMDVYEMKRLYGHRLSFCGGISTQRLLPHGTPQEVKAEVRRMQAEVGKGGGYILAPAHDIPGDAKPENVLALIEAANEG